MLRDVQHTARMGCRGPSLGPLRSVTLACPDGMRRFCFIVGRMKKRTVFLRGRRGIGSFVGGTCPKTGHVTSGLGDVAYTAFGPSSLRSPTRLGKASLTIVSKGVKITRGNTM